MHQVVVIVHPEPLQLAQDGVGLEGLEVPDLDIWHPEVLQDGQVEGGQRLLPCDLRFNKSHSEIPSLR